MFNTGQVTLPKARRKQFDTKQFHAEEVDWSLVITPIITKEDKTVFYESKDWNFWIYNDEGIDTDSFLEKLRNLQDG